MNLSYLVLSSQPEKEGALQWIPFCECDLSRGPQKCKEIFGDHKNKLELFTVGFPGLLGQPVDDLPL